MVTIQLLLDPETSARLAFLAEMWEQRKVEVALDLLKDSVSRKFNEHCNKKATSQTTPQTPLQTRLGRRGTRDQVIYTGSDTRLQSGEAYKSFAEVLRIVRPDLAKHWPEGKLYSAKTHGGDKAENILRQYVLDIYKDLSRISNNRRK